MSDSFHFRPDRRRRLTARTISNGRSEITRFSHTFFLNSGCWVKPVGGLVVKTISQSVSTKH